MWPLEYAIARTMRRNLDLAVVYVGKSFSKLNSSLLRLSFQLTENTNTYAMLVNFIVSCYRALTNA